MRVRADAVNLPDAGKTRCRRGALASFHIILLTATLNLFSWSARADAQRGAALFERECAVCHGPTGKGDGPAAPLLGPKARDFTQGIFKLRTTETGELPTDADLIKTITRGMPSTGMPSFTDLGNEAISDLVDFVKTIGGPEDEEGNWFELYEVPDPISIPAAPPPSTATITDGAKLYVLMGCDTCHGKTGRGDGKPPEELPDNWGYPLHATSFVKGIYKGGHEPGDLYTRIMTGMDGSPMTSFWKDALTPNERWSIVHYISSFGEPREVRQPSKGELKLFANRPPENVDDVAWKNVASDEVPRMPLTGGWMGRFSPLRVQGVADEGRLHIRVRDEDGTAGQWRAVTLVFQDGPNAPIFGLGSPEDPVLVWNWNKNEGARALSATGPATREPAPHNLRLAAELGKDGTSILMTGPRPPDASHMMIVVEGEKDGNLWVTSSTYLALLDGREGN